MSSQELEWELGDIFDGGIFAFPVDEPDVARSVVRYLLMRGVLAEEIADSIEQPGSTTDLVAWLGGDERKSMIGVWATAWLNDARRRHDTDRRRRRRTAADFRSTAEVVVVVGRRGGDDGEERRSPSPAGVEAASGGEGRRQMSLDSDFGGSEDSVFGAGSRKGSIEGVCEVGSGSASSDHATTDEDEIGSCALEPYRRSISDDNVLTADERSSFPSTYVVLRDRHGAMRRRRGGSDIYGSAVPPERTCSELYDIGSGIDDVAYGTADVAAVVFPAPTTELSDSGNVSEAAVVGACSRCGGDANGNGRRADGYRSNGSSVDSVDDNAVFRGHYYYEEDHIVSDATVKRRLSFRRQHQQQQQQRRPNTAGSTRVGYQPCGTVTCRCTLSHYTAASASLQTVVFAVAPTTSGAASRDVGSPEVGQRPSS